MLVRAALRFFAPPAMVFALVAARCGSDGTDASSASSDAAPAAAAQDGPTISAAKFCPALQAKAQPYSKKPLDIIMANDASNDDLHKGEDGYVSCTFGHANEGYRVTIGMHAGDVSKFEGTSQQGFSVLPGFGDQARAYEASIRWVDVVKGTTACEAILTIANEDLTESDWKQAGGKMCNAAFGLYH